MVDELRGGLLTAGSSVRFEDCDDLLTKLDELDQPVPARHEGRKLDHREHFCIVRYLRFLAGAKQSLLPLPLTLEKPPRGQDPPDFLLQWDDGRSETFEISEGSTREFQKELSRTSGNQERPVRPVDEQTPTSEALKRWAEILFDTFRRKASALERGRFAIDHLLIYDVTGLSLLLPLEDGHALLRNKIERWLEKEQPKYRFKRISVLRDGGLLYDIGANSRVLKGGSPYFQLPTIRASDAADLRQRLRDLDRFCRTNSIRHLKLFGSVLGDREVDTWRAADDLSGEKTRFFRGDSDLDLLVEFEPGTRVTLLDMARMERELSELSGFRVDLRTVDDLSRYFRKEILNDALEIRARPA